MSIHKPSRVEIEDADDVALDGVRARLTQGCHPIIGLLERLSDESLDDLSSELSALNADDMVELVTALDSLDRLANRLKPVDNLKLPGESDDSRHIRLSKAQGSVTEFADAVIDDLAAMLMELMSTFEASAEYDAAKNATWCSPGRRCEVSKSGQSAALRWSLQQDPEAVFAEYRILLDGEEVWSWSDKVWPDLSVEVAATPIDRIPTLCLEAITHYLEQQSAEWIARFREANQHRERSNQTSA